MEKCEKEKFILEYFGMKNEATSENTKIITDFGQIVNLLAMWDESSTNEMRQLAHDGLPDDCINGWGEVKFCPNQQGPGNSCKRCSHFV